MITSLRVACAIAIVPFGCVLSAVASTVQVTVGTSPAGVAFTVDGTQYTSVQTLTWTVGSSHTLSATSPQTDSTTQYTFSSWSDSGAISHNVTASSTTTSYTADFTTSFELALATNNTHGTVTPTSGSFYSSGSKVSIVATPAGGYTFNGWTGSTDIADTSASSTSITMNGPESITANFKRSGGGIQYITLVFDVTTTADDQTGVAANCPLGGPANGTGLNCSLRDALEAASEAGAGSIQFDSTVFASSNTAAQNTIVLTNGPLYIPSSTTLEGPWVKNGNSLANRVTVSGNNQSSVFWVSSGVRAAEIDNLSIVNGSNTFGGGGIYVDGKLTVLSSTVSGNSSSGGEGGGIYIDSNGSLRLKYSTISGNSADMGAGIADDGSLTAAESTIAGNTAVSLGGGIYVAGQTVVSDCTVATNSAISGSGGGIEVVLNKSLKLANSIVSGNDSASPVPDLEGSFTDAGGNEIAAGPLNLAPLGNYGGPTQTMIPLPWSPAICVGLTANVSAIVATDQRGLPNVNSKYPGYSVASPCVDSGAVQTNYSLAFSSQPAPIAPGTTLLMQTPFTAAVTLTENGNPVPVPVSIPLSLTGTGSLTGGSANSSNGVATFSSLQVSTAGSGDVLMASLPLNPPLSPFPLAISTASNAFDIVSLSTTTAAASLTIPFSATAQAVILNATVTTSSETVNAGTVTFTLMSGNSPIGVPVTSAAITNGQAMVSYILPAAVAPGAYSIHAVYNAAGGFTASSDSTHTLTITQAGSSVALTSSAGTSNLNASITFTAVISGSAAAIPTGSVNFMDGTQSLGTATLNAQGVATYSTTSLTVGTHIITAVYSGDADFAAATSAQYTQSVTAPAFTVTASPSTLSIVSGQTGTAKFTLTPAGGFTGSVSFACGTLPEHVSCSFSPASVAADGSNTPQSTTLTISTSAQMANNTAPPLPGSSDGAPLTARFTPIPGFALGLLLWLGRRRLQRTGMWLVFVVASAALLAGTACGGGSSSQTPAGTYTMQISATPGSGSSGGVAPQTVVFTITVTK